MIQNNTLVMDVKSKYKYYGLQLWFWCEVAMVVMSVISLYILVCIIHFVWWLHAKHAQRRTARTKFQRGSSTTTHSGSTVVSYDDVEFTRPGRRNKRKQQMNYMCLMAALQLTLKLGIDQGKFFHAWHAKSDTVCELWYDITDIFIYGGVVISIYGFLWLKQWIFYQNPAVEGLLYSRHIVTFSRIFVVIILVLSLSLTVTNTIAERYIAGNTTFEFNNTIPLNEDPSYLGCVSNYDMENMKDSWSLIAYVILASTFQAVLLGLFLYPLIRERMDKCKGHKCINISDTQCLKQILCHKKQTTDANDNRPIPTCSPTTEKKNYRHPRGQSLSEPTLLHKPAVGSSALNSIRRAVIWTSICVITDVTLVSVFAKMGKGTPLILVAVVTNLDLLVNLLCVIATYSRWCEILFPFLNKCSREKKKNLRRRMSSIPEHNIRLSPLIKVLRKKKSDKPTISNMVVS